MARLLNNWLDAFMEYTDQTEPPDSFRKWVGISCIAAALQRECFTRWEKEIYPNLYIVLVGKSGCRKGTAMYYGNDLLSRLGETVRRSPDSTTREQLIVRLRQASKHDVVDGKHIMHSSLTIFSEELTVFLGYNNNQLMADLCNWYDCPNRWDYETKNKGKQNILNVWVNLIGATTPRLLQTTLPQDTIGGGLSSRIIFVFEHDKGKIISRPFMTPKMLKLRDALLHDLEAMTIMRGEFIPTEDYLQKYDKWYMSEAEKMPFDDYRFDGYKSRRATHIRKLSMVMRASKGSSMELTGEDFDDALRELVTIEKNMEYVFRGVGRSDISDIMETILTTIISYGDDGITFNQLLGIHYNDVDYDTLNRIFTTLLSLEKDGKKLFKLADLQSKRIVYIGN